MDEVELEPGVLLTVEQVAQRLQVPRSWIYEHTRPASRPCLPHLKLGKYLRFRREDIDDFIKQGRKDHVA
jgi:excisionase family DNA binding protein